MDYKKLLEAYMANVFNTSGEMAKAFGDDRICGDFLGRKANNYLSPEELQELRTISTALDAEGKFNRE